MITNSAVVGNGCVLGLCVFFRPRFQTFPGRSVKTSQPLDMVQLFSLFCQYVSFSALTMTKSLETEADVNLKGKVNEKLEKMF